MICTYIYIYIIPERDTNQSVIRFMVNVTQQVFARQVTSQGQPKATATQGHSNPRPWQPKAIATQENHWFLWCRP